MTSYNKNPNAVQGFLIAALDAVSDDPASGAAHPAERFGIDRIDATVARPFAVESLVGAAGRLKQELVRLQVDRQAEEAADGERGVEGPETPGDAGGGYEVPRDNEPDPRRVRGVRDDPGTRRVAGPRGGRGRPSTSPR